MKTAAKSLPWLLEKPRVVKLTEHLGIPAAGFEEQRLLKAGEPE